MRMKLLAGMFGAIVTTALISGVALSGGLGGGGSASAQADDIGDDIHTACERGDFGGMLTAMEDMLSEEDHEAMMEHMAEMHDEATGHMHDDDADHMGGDDWDDMHDGDAGHMHSDDADDMMGGMGSAGMMGGGMMGGSMR